MCYYCKAASAVLDILWDDMRGELSAHGIDLSDLGPLTHEVFVPAYRKVREGIDAQGLMMLEAQVTEDLLQPYYDRPGFHEVWDEWDQETRDSFIREQSEAKLAELLLKFYADDFIDAYQTAYAVYRANNS